MSSSEKKQLSSMPNDFLWGGAISATQVEGAYNRDGKGLSNLDLALRCKKGETSNNSTSGCKSILSFSSSDWLL